MDCTRRAYEAPVLIERSAFLREVSTAALNPERECPDDATIQADLAFHVM